MQTTVSRELWLENAMAQYEAPLLRLCCALLGDAALAEDAVQDTFIRAWRALPHFRGDSSEKTWLTHIAVNVCRDLQRKGWFRHEDRRVSLDTLPEPAAPCTAQQDAVARALQERPEHVQRIGLLGMEMSESLDTAQLATDLKGSGCMLSFSSLRADRLSPQLLDVLGKSALKSAAIAADGASERLRRVINKNISAQDLCNAAIQLVEAGIFHLKIYVMIGLPGESEADLMEFADLIRTIRAAILPLGRARGRVSTLSLSLNCFVPKAWTPFQYCSFGGGALQGCTEARPAEQLSLALASLKEKTRFLRNLLQDEANLHFICDSPDQALEQAVYARADRRIAPMLLAQGTGRLSFKMAMKRFIDQGRPGSGIWNYALRPRSQDELFPWDVIEHGFTPGYMWQEYTRALRGLTTAPCEPQRCRRCGVCHAEV